MQSLENPIRTGWLVSLSLLLSAAVSLPAMAGEEPAEMPTDEEVVATVIPVGPKEGKPYVVFRGKFFDVVDYPTFNGFRRYHADCHVCHGPDGMGSTYAPALVESLKTLTFEDFFEVTINGRQRLAGNTMYVMPAFGENPNVINHLQDIYAYLKARSDGVLRRGRPHRLPKDFELPEAMATAAEGSPEAAEGSPEAAEGSPEAAEASPEAAEASGGETGASSGETGASGGETGASGGETGASGEKTGASGEKTGASKE